MSIRQQKGFKALAVFVAFAIAQVCVQISFAEPPSAPPGAPLPQQFVAKLTTRNNQSILVNSNNAATGATILTGATIETPADVGATIDLGPLGTLDLAPNTRIRLEFDQNGKVKVTLITGCVLLHGKKKTQGEVDTEQGTPVAKTDNKKSGGGLLDVCFPPGAAGPTVGQGAAAAAGAGAGATVGAATGGGGVSTTVLAIVITGGILGASLPFVFRGENPSPSR